MKVRKMITSIALAGVIATSSIVPCTMTAQCAAIEDLTGKIKFPGSDKKGVDIPFEITESGVNYRGGNYACTYTNGDYTYFRVEFRCNSGGCTATINRVYVLDGEIHVDASVIGPKPGILSTSVITCPYVTGRIAKTGKPIVFDGVAGTFGKGNYI